MHRTSRRGRLGLIACVGALAVTGAACGGSDVDEEGTTGAAGAASSAVESATAAAELSGKVAIDGSSTVAPISNAVAEEFQKEQSNVQVTVGTSGTGGGFEKFCNGEIDIADASRPIKDEEKAACQAKGIEYVEVPVASDGLSIVVNPENDFVKCLTVEQLNKMWDQGSKVKTWKDVDPSFPADPIKLYGPGTDSGTFDFFTDEINGEEGKSRTDYTASEDDNVLVQGVAGDRAALAYFGLAYFEENQDKLKAVEVNGGNGCVAPSPATVKDGTYKPLSRPLFIYVSQKAAQRPEVAGFVAYYLANAPTVVEEVQYVPLDAADYQTSAAQFTTAGSGNGSSPD